MNARPLRTTAGGGKKAALAAARRPERGQLRDDRGPRRRARRGHGATAARSDLRRPRPRRHGHARPGDRRRGLCPVGRDRARTRTAPRPALSRSWRDARVTDAVELIPCARCSASSPSRSRWSVTAFASPSPTPRTSTASTSCASPRHAVDVYVASREDILNEIARVARQTEVLETQTAIDELQVDGGRGGARGRRRRLGRATRAARQLDHHAGGRRRRLRHPLRAQEDALSVRTRVDGVSPRRSGSRSGWRRASRPASRCSPSSTSPSGASPRTAASR